MFSALLVWTFVDHASAQLAWDTQHHYAEPGDDEFQVRATFSFENTGSYPLTVVSIRALDDGLRARQVGSKRTIRPGEIGAVVLSYPNSGVFTETMLRAEVRTDERGDEPITLAVTVAPEGWSDMTDEQRAAVEQEGQRLRELPAPLTIKPRMLLWRPGRPPHQNRSR